MSKLYKKSRIFNNQKLLTALPSFGYTPIEKAVEICCKAYFNKINP
jgi:hypothetical protein